MGSAKSGARHWVAERVSALALVPLTIWLVVSLVVHARHDYAEVVGWLREPVTAVSMTLSLVALFHHAALGLQVVIEDYIHSGAKYPAIIAVRMGCYGTALAGIGATLSIAFR
jgi:succinate dehydrogenase / fumarate reductase membrane anchor subunit